MLLTPQTSQTMVEHVSNIICSSSNTISILTPFMNHIKIDFILDTNKTSPSCILFEHDQVELLNLGCKICI